MKISDVIKGKPILVKDIEIVNALEGKVSVKVEYDPINEFCWVTVDKIKRGKR